MVNTLRNVEHITGTTGTTSNSAQTYTISTLLNVDRAFAIVHFRHNQVANHDGTWHAWAITSTTQLTIWNGASTVSIDFDAYIIEFDAASDIRVQVGTLGELNAATPAIQINSSTPGTSTLSPAVTLAESMSYLTGHQQTGTDTTIGQEEFTRTRLTGTTTWEHARVVNPNSAEPVHRFCVADWNDANVDVQRGQATIGTTSTSHTLTGGGTDFNTVDWTRTIIFIEPLNAEANFSQPMDEGMIQVAISGDNLVVTRQAQGGFAINYNWQLVEFPSGFLTVEHLIHTMGATTTSNSDTIATLADFNNAFVMSHTNNGGFAWDGARPSAADTASGTIGQYQLTMDLSSNTNVNFDRGDGTIACTIGYQVVEFLAGATIDEDHTTDTLIQAAIDETHTTDTLVKVVDNDESHTTDLLIQEIVDAVHTTDIAINAAGNLVHTADILIQEEFDITHITDVLIQQSTNIVHSTDLFVLAPGQITQTSDVLIKVLNNDIINTSDILVQDDFSLNFNTDISIKTIDNNLVFTSDILVSEIFDLVQTVDTLVQLTSDIAHTTDTDVKAPVDVSHGADTFVGSSEIEHTTDILIVANLPDDIINVIMPVRSTDVTLRDIKETDVIFSV